MVVDRVTALDTAGSQMDPVAIERDCTLAFPAESHIVPGMILLMEEEP